MKEKTETEVKVEAPTAVEVIEDKTTRVVDMTMFFGSLAFKARKRELDARPMLEPPRILKLELAAVTEKVDRVERKLRRSEAAKKAWVTRRRNAEVRKALAYVDMRLVQNSSAEKRDGVWICLPDRCFKIVGRAPGECSYCLSGL